MKKGLSVMKCWLISVLLVGTTFAIGQTTTLQDTVHRADGTAAHGTVLVSWPAFTTASGQDIARGNTSVTLSATGGLNLSLAPNAGAVPAGTYYTAVYHLDDGSVNREYWVVPVSNTPVTLQAVKASVLPASVAMQTVTKQYVDAKIEEIKAQDGGSGATGDYVLKSGDTMTGPLVLPADPTSSMQATTKNYVDTNVAALQAGLGLKVATTPAQSQTVMQPANTQLTVNHLNGVMSASGFQSGNGRSDGVRTALSQPDCASGCDLMIEHNYSGTDAFDMSAPRQTHFIDRVGGGQWDYYIDPHNPVSSGVDAGQQITVVQTQKASEVNAFTPGSYGLMIDHEALAGGNNLYPFDISPTIPYFKSTFGALSMIGHYYTEGQHVLDEQETHCYAVGDCLAGSRFVYSAGGYRDNADEGTHGYDFELREDSHVFRGTCTSGCSTGSTSLTITATADAGTQGEGRFLLNTNAAKVLSGGSLIGGKNTSSPFPTANFSGTDFAVSTFFMLKNATPPQAKEMSPGTVVEELLTTGLPAGYQSSTIAAPSSQGVACVVDYAPGGSFNVNNYEMATYSVVDGSHIQFTFNKPHNSGATVSMGGLCGYGLEQTVDTVNGIRQVFPVVGSVSATSLYYASGLAPIVGTPYTTSAFQNVSQNITSIARANGVVTVTLAGNMSHDLNGLTLTVSGVADSSYNGSFVVTSTGPNTLTYAQSGANSTSSGGSVGLLTGGYKLYPMAETLGVINPSTRQVDGTLTLAPNTVAWEANDPVEMPHFYQMDVGGDFDYISQQIPRPGVYNYRGISYEQNVGPGLRGWIVRNAAPATNYLGNGGMHLPPDYGMMVDGEWDTSLQVEAGDSAAIDVLCNSRGCGKWNSNYDLIRMHSNANVGAGTFDALSYAPQTSTLTFNMRGTSYSLSPTALTAGTINVATLNAGHINGLAASATVDTTNASNIVAGVLPDAVSGALTGDVTKPAGSSATTLATVNATTGTFGSSAAVPVVTVNAKGLVTGVSTAALGTAASVNTGTSGATVPLLNAAGLAFSNAVTFSGGLSASGVNLVATTNLGLNGTHAYVTYSPGVGDVILKSDDADAAAAVVSYKTNAGATGHLHDFRNSTGVVGYVDINGNAVMRSVSAAVESVTFSAAPTFSVNYGSSRIVLTGNVTSSTLAAGTDGQRKCFNIVQDATGGRSFTWPTNVSGGMTIGTAANKHNQQCFVYYAGDGAWLAESSGVVNE